MSCMLIMYTQYMLHYTPMYHFISLVSNGNGVVRTRFVVHIIVLVQYLHTRAPFIRRVFTTRIAEGPDRLMYGIVVHSFLSSRYVVIMYIMRSITFMII